MHRNTKQFIGIQGLVYVRDYLDNSDHDELLSRVDDSPWEIILKRRTQHYGYRYDYRKRSVTPGAYLGPLPSWAERIACRLAKDEYFVELPNQLIVNEYLPGQGISAHVDCVPCFDQSIVSISLGGDCMMEFTFCNGNRRKTLFLENKSLLLLSGESRYSWKHAIPPRKSDVVGGTRLIRSRRISMTFRSVITA